LVVFLVALPLCLGIALASGAPLFSGVIAGIIGGIVIGSLSGSEISVSGPAAGLAVIVATAIQNLGSFEFFLVAVVIAGAIQLLLGIIRAGIIGDYVPNSVIKGMLAAIGILIILKQIPHGLGYDASHEIDIGFFERGTVAEIIKALYTFSPGAVVIVTISLAILILWEQPFLKKHGFFKLVPGALIVVVLGIILNETFRSLSPGFYLRPEDGHLVALPVSESIGGFFRQFTLPDWAALQNKQVYITGATIAIVGSIETLLSIEAADRLDPFHRISSTNRELRAQGVGNMLSGLLGGLPITAVIVRTSANIYAGGRTRTSAIFHALLLFISALLIPMLLNLIPLASLAAVLFMVGYKLTKVDLYRKMYKDGMEQFLPFIVTVVAIVMTDLLIGILIGMIVGLFFVIKTNHHSALTIVRRDNFYLMRFNKDVSFVNKSALKDALARIPNGSHLIIDGTKAVYIDHDIYDVITDFEASAKYRRITLELNNLESKLQPFWKAKQKDGLLQEAAAQ
jgi:MFS superfamily sulfate permease-like transporter